LEEKDLFKEVLGKYLKLKRYMKDLTLEELAELTNLDDKHIGKIERGEKLPSSHTLYKLSISLNISIDALFLEVTEELRALNSPDTK
jgi:transcriptional regulator with XRE-family HTH domain